MDFTNSNLEGINLVTTDKQTQKYEKFRFQEKNPNLNRDSNLGSPGSGSNCSLEI